MYIYVIIELLLLIFTIRSFLGFKKTVVWFNILAGVILFVCAFRAKTVGGDLRDYVDFFTGYGGLYGTLSAPNDHIEFGYVLLNKFFSILGRNPFIIIFFSVLLSMLPLFVYYKKYSQCKIASLYAFMCICSLFGFYLTALRQVIALGLCLIAFFVWQKHGDKKTYLSIPILVFAFFVHSFTIIIVIVVGLIYLVKIRKNIGYILIFISFFLALSNVAKSALGYVFELISSIDYVDIYSVYATKYDQSSQGVNILIPINVLILLCLYFQKENKYINYPMRILLVALVTNNILYNFPIYFRLTSPLYALGFAAIPYPNISEKILKIVYIIVLSYFLYRCYIYYSSYSTLYPYWWLAGDKLLPYKFIFE